jgi:hypothetical protein
MKTALLIVGLLALPAGIGIYFKNKSDERRAAVPATPTPSYHYYQPPHVINSRGAVNAPPTFTPSPQNRVRVLRAPGGTRVTTFRYR